MSEPQRDCRGLELNLVPEGWRQPPGKIGLLLVAINTPHYTSLAVRLLALLIHRNEELNNRYDVRFIEIERNQSLAAIVKAIAVWRPALIGLSVNVWNQQNCIDLSMSIKEVSPETVVLCGGQEVTRSFTDYLREVPTFDYLIDGEGELPLQQFLRHFQPQHGLVDPEQVSGLWYRSGGISRFTRPADLVENLDDLPSVVLAGLLPANPGNVLGVMLEGTRGCPFHCAFCFEGYRRCTVRSASVERLVAELHFMAERGAHFFHILDPIFFNSDLKRLQRISGALREIRKKYDCSISIEAYADQINEENIEYFSLFSVLDLGLQSINEKTLQAIHRRYSPDKFRRGLALLRQTRASTNVYLISGLPYETVLTFLRGIRFVLQQRPSRLFCNELLLLNGTELRQRAAEYGYEFAPLAPYTAHASTWMSRRELLLVQLAAIVIYTRYNMASRKSYAATPGYDPTDNPVDAVYAVRSGCRHGCPGCTNSQLQAFDRRQERMEELLSGEWNRLDIRCGRDFHPGELFRLLAHTHLAEINYLQLAIPGDAPIDVATVCELFRYSVLHYQLYISADGCAGQLDQATAATLAALTSVVNYGDHPMKPFLEVVVLAGHSDLPSYLALLAAICRYAPNMVAVVDDCHSFTPEWQEALAAYFDQARQEQVWLKLPEMAMRQVLPASADREEILAELAAFDLLAAKEPHPPCYAPPE